VETEKETLVRDSCVQKSQSFMISLCILVEFQSSHKMSLNIELFEMRECTCTCIFKLFIFSSVEIFCNEGTGTI
jgi:hypothetical protein